MGPVDVPRGQDVPVSSRGRPGSSFWVSGQLYRCLERHVEWVVTLPTTPPFLCAGVLVARLAARRSWSVNMGDSVMRVCTMCVCVSVAT